MNKPVFVQKGKHGDDMKRDMARSAEDTMRHCLKFLGLMRIPEGSGSPLSTTCQMTTEDLLAATHTAIYFSLSFCLRVCAGQK